MWKNLWEESFLRALKDNRVDTILDMGCGLGFECARLAELGFTVTGTDISENAIDEAKMQRGNHVSFLVHDMATTQPFEDDHFDAVMSNVAFHMFDDATSRFIISELQRVVKAGGLLLLHVNSTKDKELREALHKPSKEKLADNYYLEKDGQTMHFFSKEYLQDILSEWTIDLLEHVEVCDPGTQIPQKRVWRCIAKNSG